MQTKINYWEYIQIHSYLTFFLLFLNVLFSDFDFFGHILTLSYESNQNNVQGWLDINEMCFEYDQVTLLAGLLAFLDKSLSPK